MVRVENQRRLYSTAPVRPSTILLKPGIFPKLLDILMGSETKLVQQMLAVLNCLPTLPPELSELQKCTDFEDFLCFDAPHLFLYRIHMLGNQLRMQTNLVVAFFKKGGMTTFLNIIINVAAQAFEASDVVFLLRFANWVLSLPGVQILKSTIIAEIAHSGSSLSGLLDWTKATVEGNDVNLLEQLLILLGNFDIAESEVFSGIVTKTLFHADRSIRRPICAIIRRLGPRKIQRHILISLFEDARNSRCEDYFQILAEVAEGLSNRRCSSLWKRSLKVISSYYVIPPDRDPIGSLTFRSPPHAFTQGFFRVLGIIASRMESLPELELLLRQMTDNIVFSRFKFYRMTEELASCYLSLLDRHGAFTGTLVDRVRAAQDVEPAERQESRLSVGRRCRGIINLGATCDIAASIQHLFHIKEFRGGILRFQSETDWLTEFQYVFAKLSLYPSSCVDILNFVKVFKGVDNEQIDPHVQQDAHEFLSLLLDRTNDKLPELAGLFRGSIIHTSVGIPGSSYHQTSTETFFTFSLEVAGYVNVDDSFKAFLEPDQFEFSNDAGQKETALRYHRISSTPTILIL
jgi:hypothetical protein